jgi:hypothetical protein
MITLNKKYTSTRLTIALEAICARLALSVHFFSRCLLHLSITWLQQYDRQSRPRMALGEGFPGENSSNPNRSVPPSPSLIFLLSPLAAGLPGTERILLRPSLPVPIILVSQTRLPPPLLRKRHLSLLLAFPHLPLVRITKSLFKTSRVSLYVSPIILSPSSPTPTPTPTPDPIPVPSVARTDASCNGAPKVTLRLAPGRGKNRYGARRLSGMSLSKPIGPLVGG